MPQWLGRISMGIYLIHMPLVQYFSLFLLGPLKWPRPDDAAYCDPLPQPFECYDFHEKSRNGFPAWSIPLLLLASFAAAEVLERTIETPLRVMLRSRGKTTPSVEQ